ncbi:hypothetical protein L4D00_23835 [Photobacterium swingsii]|uniref:Uncharacterized protein n=1 Tax=Photobacterium swingsii TaxID=680026 RepID=A0A0J8V6X7_9GAMM|nr:hypothetical protein [Photobacterium swingsii]KMV28937.1 hypothetical protein AB733_21035 [Photobacterium swingsii]PSW24612.1 hypothetical protein C9I94_11325 [Photobacterium swingsii]
MDKLTTDFRFMKSTSTFLQWLADNHNAPQNIKSPLIGWQHPSQDEINEALDSLKALLGLSETDIAYMLGSSASRGNAGRMIKRWRDGEAKIPYATWLVTLSMLGRTTVPNFNHKPETTQIEYPQLSETL